MSKQNGGIYKSPIAKSIYFDPSNCNNIDSKNVQDAIDELCAAAGVNPSFAFGREGKHSAGTWLIATETTSNKRGLPFGLNNGAIVKVTVSTTNIPDPFTLEIWYHDGNLSGATLVGSVTTTAVASTEDFIVNFPVPKGHQLACKVSATSGVKPKETGVFLIVKGTLD